MNDFKLHIDRSLYSGWTSLRVTRSIEQLAHSFSFDLSDRWGVEDLIPVEAGQSCKVSYNGEVRVTGWIDQDDNSYDSESHNLSLAGRGLTGDLVDCAAAHKGGQWRNTGLLQIVTDICDPFNISVSALADLGAVFTTFKLEDGETAYQAIERACRRRGVLAIPAASGDVILDRVGTKRLTTKLEYGKNILSGAKRNSWTDRFSQYVVKAQSRGDDNNYGKPRAGIKRTSDDAGIDRYRPTIIMADDEESGSELQKRADWERNVRAGRAKEISYTVEGWEHDDGLWSPNYLVTVYDPVLHIDDELLIVETEHVRSEMDGTITNLKLSFPQAYDVQPLPRPRATKGSVY